MTDLKSSYKVLIFDKTLRCRNFWQYNGDPLNIFSILYGDPFTLHAIISAVFYGDRDIKMESTSKIR